MRHKTDNKHHYLKDYYWSSGKLCYWRNNPNYSENTKAKLEKRLIEFTIDENKVANGEKI